MTARVAKDRGTSDLAPGRRDMAAARVEARLVEPRRKPPFCGTGTGRGPSKDGGASAIGRPGPLEGVMRRPRGRIYEKIRGCIYGEVRPNQCPQCRNESTLFSAARHK